MKEMFSEVPSMKKDDGKLITATSMAEAKGAAASNKHKEAERRRRKRINDHIATLKTFLPNAVKTDKASLLGEAVRRVVELKKAAAAAAMDSNNSSSNTASKTSPTMTLNPSETDEVKLSRCSDKYSGLIKATVCCDDRPDIVVDLIAALRSVEAKVVRAEMSTIGGRTKSVLWVRLGGGVGSESDVGLGMLGRALRMVKDKSALLPATLLSPWPAAVGDGGLVGNFLHCSDRDHSGGKES